MRIRTLEELSEFLDEELAWRKKELSTIKLTVDRSNADQSECFVRVGICMLYAHWEGFIKAAATGYVCYVSARRLMYKELAPGFVALGFRSRIMNAGLTKRSTVHVNLVSQLLADTEDRFTVACESAIDTESNLSSRVMEDILCTFDMDGRPYLTKSRLIDERLVHGRNNIAHGRFLTLDERDYQDLHIQVIGLIDRFRDDIEEAADRHLYRRENG